MLASEASSRVLQGWLQSACASLDGDVKVTRAKSVAAASFISGKRQYMRQVDSRRCIWTFDPRYLAMELVTGFVLRGRQVEMIDAFLESAQSSQSPSRIIQAIMGLGKSSVIQPALAISLSDGKSLVTSVVPSSLLDMSRRMLRSVVAAPFFNRMVITFEFERFVIPQLQGERGPLPDHDSGVQSLVVESEYSVTHLTRAREERLVAESGKSPIKETLSSRGFVVA